MEETRPLYRALVTFSNGARVKADILRLPPLKNRRRTAPLTQQEKEQLIMDNWNKSQPHAEHKVVRVHLFRN